VAMGLSSPLPCPQPRDRRAARARGTRGSLRQTLVARLALAVAISLLRFSREVRQSWREREIGPKTGTIGGPTTLTRFASQGTGRVSSAWAVEIRPDFALELGSIGNNWRPRESQRTTLSGGQVLSVAANIRGFGSALFALTGGEADAHRQFFRKSHPSI
jgi:hypothetical protein